MVPVPGIFIPTVKRLFLQVSTLEIILSYILWFVWIAFIDNMGQVLILYSNLQLKVYRVITYAYLKAGIA